MSDKINNKKFEADTIIYGNIATLDVNSMIVEAMVVKDGIIKYLGSKKIAEKMKGDNTKIYDYGDSVVYPGFMDPHTHGIMAGQRLKFQCDLVAFNKVGNMQAYVDEMEKYIKENPNRDFYLGAGWTEHEKPTAAMLDKICKDKPIVLKSEDGHSAWLNTAAIKDCNINKEYIETFGRDQVEVDKDDNPTGLLHEVSMGPVDKKYKPSKENIKEGLLAWQDFAFSQGITAVGDAFVDMYPECMDAYKELVDEGKWKLRTYGYAVNVSTLLNEPEKLASIIKDEAKKYNTEYFKIRGQKIILDGVVEAHTAALIDEYSDTPGYHGVLNINDQEALNYIVRAVNEEGYAVHTHAIGDMASKMILDAYEKVSTEICDFDLRNMICHLQVVRKEDIKRMSDLNIIAVVPPLWVPAEEPFEEQSIKYLGKERTFNAYPIKSFYDEEVTVCFHTDFPVSLAMNVPKSIFTAVTRSHLYDNDAEHINSATTKNPAEAINPLQALLAMTYNPAYAFKEENRLGTLEIGKVANATVYDRDFILCENPVDIMKAKLVATIVDGVEVYKANAQ